MPEVMALTERLQRPSGRNTAHTPAPSAPEGRNVDVNLAGRREPDALDGLLSRAVRDRASSRPFVSRRASRAAGAARLDRVLSEDELVARAHAIQSNPVPTAGANLWRFTNSETKTVLYIIGTIHSGTVITEMAQGVELLEFLQSTPFDAVYAELEERFSGGKRFDIRVDVIDVLRRVAEMRASTTNARVRDLRSTQMLSVVPNFKLDDLLVAAATNWKGCAGLETELDRAEVRAEYDAAGGANTTEHKLAKETYNTLESAVAAGNEAALNLPHVELLLEGKDLQDIESRNQRWVRSMGPKYHPGQTVLWVVGVSHLAGLRVELSGRGWDAHPVNLKPESSSSSAAATKVEVPVGTGV